MLFEICTCDGHTPSHTYDDRWHSFILSKVYDITYSTTKQETILKFSTDILSIQKRVSARGEWKDARAGLPARR